MIWSGRPPSASTCGSGHAGWSRSSTATWRPCRSRSPSTIAAPVAIRSRISSRVPVAIREATPGETPDPRLGRTMDGHVLRWRHRRGHRGPVPARLPHPQQRHDARRRRRARRRIATRPTDWSRHYGPDDAEAIITVDAEPGVPVRIVKYLAFHTSRAAPPADLVARCERTLDRAIRDGFDRAVRSTAEQPRPVLGPSRRGRRVDTFDPVRVQQAVRWNLFQLAQATWRAEGTGIPAKGLTGGAYDGHYFWDTEIYVAAVPLLHPAPHRPEPAAVPPQHAARRRGSGPTALGHAGRDVPVADDQRRGGVAPSSRRARPSTTSTPTSPTRSGATSTSAATSTSWSRSAPRSSSNGADVGGPRLLRRRRGVPPPRGHRARRVHDRGQRQRLHEPHGAAEPQLRRRCRSNGSKPSDPRRMPALCLELALDPSEPDAWDSAAACDAHPARPRSGHHPTGRHVPEPRALGPGPARRRTSSRSSCTTTRWRSIATRCSSRPTW